MENVANGHKAALDQAVRFTAADLQTIYAVFIDRFEHLDMVLRSLPTPQRREEAAEEMKHVKAVIRHFCNAGVTPAADGTAISPALSLVALPP